MNKKIGIFSLDLNRMYKLFLKIEPDAIYLMLETLQNFFIKNGLQIIEQLDLSNPSNVINID